MPNNGSPLLPRVYAILDVEMLDRRGLKLGATAGELVAAGVRLLQLRDKRGNRATVLRETREVAAAVAGSGCRLILNDWVELVGESGFDGVHVGQGDMTVSEARARLGAGRTLGVSTHTEEQMQLAAAGTADYVAVGPVFGTSTKLDAEPVVGLEGVRRARSLTGKPLVAIGGISAANAAEVLRAGADSVAVIGALCESSRGVGESARALLGAVGELATSS